MRGASVPAANGGLVRKVTGTVWIGVACLTQVLMDSVDGFVYGATGMASFGSGTVAGGKLFPALYYGLWVSRYLLVKKQLKEGTEEKHTAQHDGPPLKRGKGTAHQSALATKHTGYFTG